MVLHAASGVDYLYSEWVLGADLRNELGTVV